LIRRGEVREFDKVKLSGLSNLEILKLIYFELDLNINRFKELTNLRHLKLIGCTLESCNSEFFMNFLNLKYLSIINDLKMPFIINHNFPSNLKFLHFIGNFKFFNNFGELQNLRVLEIHVNKGWHFDQIESLTNLEVLRIVNKDRTEHILKEGTFQNFKRLKKLYLHFFAFEKIEKNAFFDLDQLTHLHMSIGKEKFPLRLETNSFKGLSNLKEIDFYDCNVSFISKDFFDIFPKLSKRNRMDNSRKYKELLEPFKVEEK
jgi:Leucine-rich repeat (LRR) protein